MENLSFMEKHNIVAFLDGTHERAADFIEAFNFLVNSRVYHAISSDTFIFRDMIQEFWSNVQFEVIEGIPTLLSSVQESTVRINEGVIRRVLQFNDVDGITELPIEEVHQICREAGYERDFPGQMVKKTRFSFNWRYIIHVLIHCVSSRQGGFDEMGHKLASGFVCLITGRMFNFSGFVFDNLKRHLLESKKKFLLYPRFLQLILNSDLEGLMPEGEVLNQQHMTWKVLGNMKKNFPATGFSGNFTPFFPQMLHGLHEDQADQVMEQQQQLHISPVHQSPVAEVSTSSLLVYTSRRKGGSSKYIASSVALKAYQPHHSAQSSVNLEVERLKRDNVQLLSQVTNQKLELVSTKLAAFSQKMLIEALQGEIRCLRSNPLDDASKIGGDCLQVGNVDNAENVENVENIETENVENIETENVENVDNTENVENVENVGTENVEGQRCIDELQEWLDGTDTFGNEVVEETRKKPVEEEGSGSKIVRIVNPTNEELRAERRRLEEIKKGISAKIMGWRFDPTKNAIVIKRTDNHCTYFRSTTELMNLTKEDLVQLYKLKMVNHGLYPHGTEFEQMVQQHAASNFSEFERRFKKKRSTMSLDRVPLPVAKKKKEESKVIGWRMDCLAHEIVIEREDGSKDRLYEDADIRALSNADLIAMNQLPFRDHDDYPDGKHYLKVLDYCIECIEENLR